MRVFIADLATRFRRELIALLSEMEAVEVVGQAGDAVTALAGIQQLRPDVVMLDIHISEGSGLELLRKIRREDRSVIAIMMTNQPPLPYRKACMSAGADFLFDKANEINEVKKVIHNLLPRFRRIDA